MSLGSHVASPRELSPAELLSLLRTAAGAEKKNEHIIVVHSTTKTITKKDAKGNEYQVTRPLVGPLAKQFPTLSRRERRQMLKAMARAKRT